jgi:hypothetical protein
MKRMIRRILALPRAFTFVDDVPPSTFVFSWIYMSA